MGGIVERYFRCAECSRCQKQTDPVPGDDVCDDAKARGWVFPGTNVDVVYCPKCLLEMYNESQRQQTGLARAGTCPGCHEYVPEGERCSCH